MDERSHLRDLAARLRIELSEADLDEALPAWRKTQAALRRLRDALPEEALPLYSASPAARAAAYRRAAPPGDEAASGTGDRGATAAGGRARREADDLGLCGLEISALAPLIQSKQVSPVEVTQAYLERIERLDGTVQSYLTLTPERALADARRAADEIQAGGYRGPLHGVPFGLKDLLDTAGIRTTGNSASRRDRVPGEDADVPRRLEQAGMVLLGKLRLHEFAMGSVYPEHPLGIARNPWGPDRSPGGSSTGSGAALAARLCAGSIGTDTGGSIRIPAAYSGITGLKPTFGRVSRRGVIPLAWSLDHVGPMARSVADAALILQAIAGHDPLDPFSADVPVPDYAQALGRSVRGLRIGAPLAFVEGQTAAEPDVWQAYRAALDVLAGLGAEIVDVQVDAATQAMSYNQLITSVEAASYHERRLAEQADLLGPGFRGRMLQGVFASAADYVQALRGRAVVVAELDGLLNAVDLLATPTMPQTAPTFEEMRTDTRAAHVFTGIFNLTGLPALSIPCGFDSRGLPIGLMLAGRCFDEPTVLRAGDAYQRATDWHRRVPPLVA